MEEFDKALKRVQNRISGLKWLIITFSILCVIAFIVLCMTLGFAVAISGCVGDLFIISIISGVMHTNKDLESVMLVMAQMNPDLKEQKQASLDSGKLSDQSGESSDSNDDQTNTEDYKKISSKHFDKIIDRTMDRNIIKDIRDSYTEKDGFYCLTDSIDTETKTFLSRYMKEKLDEIIKVEKLKEHMN